MRKSDEHFRNTEYQWMEAFYFFHVANLFFFDMAIKIGH